MSPDRKTLFLYIAKCVSGGLFVFLISWLINYKDFSWCIISVMLVLTPESSEAISLAITRIKANFIGGIVSIFFILINLPLYLSISLSVVLTILACNHFKLMTGSRAAIAAVIIIMMHGEEFSHPNFWSITFQRLASVIIGCLIGLLVTIIFNQRQPGKRDEKLKQIEA